MANLDGQEALVIGVALLSGLIPAAFLYVRSPRLKDELDGIFFRRVLLLVVAFAGIGFLLGVAPTQSGRTREQNLLLFLAVGAAGGFLAHSRLGGVLVACGFVGAFGVRVAWGDPAGTIASGSSLLRLAGIHAAILLATAAAGWIGGWGSVALDRIRTSPRSEERGPPGGEGGPPEPSAARRRRGGES